MIFYASSKTIKPFPVDIEGKPTLIFEQIKVKQAIKSSNCECYISGPHHWEKLMTKSDMSLLYGQFFNLQNDEWLLEDRIVHNDNTIHIGFGKILI